MGKSEKPVGSFFVPYKLRGSEVHVFLQRRSLDAPRNPGLTGLFGGAPEPGETPEENFLREVREELNYTPRKPYPLGVYYSGDIMHVFAEEVSDGFENEVIVGEGLGGVFVNLADLNSYQVPPRHARVLEDLRHYINHLDALMAKI